LSHQQWGGNVSFAEDGFARYGNQLTGIEQTKKLGSTITAKIPLTSLGGKELLARIKSDANAGRAYGGLSLGAISLP
jgi:hypothetical protein